MGLSMLCPRGGGRGPQDEVGALIVCACPTWGIFANFEQQEFLKNLQAADSLSPPPFPFSLEKRFFLKL